MILGHSTTMNQDKVTVATKGTGRPAPIKPGLCLCILFLVLILVGSAGVSVYFLIRDEFRPVHRERFVGTLTLDRPWDDALADKSSAAYRNLETDVCTGLAAAIEQKTDECAVNSFEQGSIEAHFVTVVIVRDVDELNGVIEQYRQGVTVAGQNATVTVVADPGGSGDNQGGEGGEGDGGDESDEGGGGGEGDGGDDSDANDDSDESDEGDGAGESKEDDDSDASDDSDGSDEDSEGDEGDDSDTNDESDDSDDSDESDSDGSDSDGSDESDSDGSDESDSDGSDESDSDGSDDSDESKEEEPFPVGGVVAADGAYLANWTSDSETITVTIVGRTQGWVGFGISGTGGMKEADIMMAWVDDSGAGHILDTYSEQNGAPVIDTFSQDWKLLEASEDDEFTRVTVRRFIRLCDYRDRNITSGTLKVIWALGTTDPNSETSLSPYTDYHGNRRGTASRRLLDTSRPPPSLPEDAFSLDFLQNNVSIPNDTDTTYLCRVIPVPQMDQKHHYIMGEPVIQEGNELYVHHILLYVCYGTEDASKSFFANEGIDCRPRQHCTYIITAWAVGGTAQYFPQHTGIPLGGPDSPQYLMLESHYDNPHFHTGVVDSSGLRLWLTPSLRQYDAALLWAGMTVNPLHMIPPGVEDFITSAHCTEQCLNQGLADLDSGIRIFGGLLHTHLAGVSVVVRHIRNGIELPPILEDRSYDFDYQNFIFLDMDEEVTVLPGDRLIVECGYSTKDREETTYGGLGTYDEMCIAFLLHYPAMSMKRCLSTPTIPQLVKAIPGAMIRWDTTLNAYFFTAPEQLAGYPVLGTVDYLLTNIDRAAEALQLVNRDGGISTLCDLADGFQRAETEVPPVETPYTETTEECREGTEDLPEK